MEPTVVPAAEFDKLQADPAPAGPTVVPADQFDALQDDSQKYGSLPQQALAGVEGFGRGASFGLSDQLEARSGAGDQEVMKARIAQNPWTSGIGTLLGGATTIGLTGGAAAPAEAIAGGAGLGATLLAGAGEGALFGAGNAVTDNALGDKDLNAQKILADVGMGAAFGAGLGGLSKFVESAAPAATQKLSSALGNLKESVMGTEEAPSAFAQGLSKVGGGITGKGSEDYASALKQGMALPEADTIIPKVASNLQDVWNASDTVSKEMYEKILPQKIEESLSQMPLEEAQGVASGVVKKLEPLLSEESPLSAATKKVVGTRLEDLQQDLIGAQNASDVHAALHEFAKDLDKNDLIKFDTLPTASQKFEQEALWDARNAVRSNLSDQSLWGDAGMHYAETTGDYAGLQNDKKWFRKTFMKQTPSGWQINPNTIKTFVNNIDEHTQSIRGDVLNNFINRMQSLAQKSENFHGAEAGESAIAKHIESLADKHQQLADVASAMNEGKQSNGLLGGTNGEILKAGMLHAIGLPNPVVGAAIAAHEAFSAIKNPYQLGRTLSNTFSKLKALGEVSQNVGNKISSMSKSIFENGASRGALLSITTPRASYDNRVKAIQQLNNDPGTMINKLDNTTKHMYEAAPNISQGLHSAMINGAQFLNSKIPQNPNPMPLSSKFEPSISQKETFERYYKAVDNPLSALKEVKSGTLSAETMESLQAVHPQLLQEMRKEVLSNINPKKMQAMPYDKKLCLAKFLGQPLDENMLPQMIAHNQMVLQANPSQGQQAAQSVDRNGSTLGGLKELNVAKRSATRTQELEEDSV